MAKEKAGAITGAKPGAKPGATAAAKPAKAKSGGSGFNWKAFLLQYGERISMAYAVVQTLLIIVIALVWPSDALFGPSATELAQNLSGPADRLDAQLKDPNNLPGDN